MAADTLPQIHVDLLTVAGPSEGPEFKFPNWIPSLSPEESCYRMSRKSDLTSLHQVSVNTLYKRVADKKKPINLGSSDGTKPLGNPNWRAETIAQETYVHDPESKYAKFLIPKFSKIAKGARLKPQRLAEMRIGSNLTPQERELLTEMLYNREAVLSWNFEEMGKVREDVVPPQEIRTVPHDAWQCKGFNVPKALQQQVIEMLEERVKKGIYESCHGPYRNGWFLVGKQEKGKYRLVNACTIMNSFTIRDANMPPAPDEFAESFAGDAIASVVDMFSGYDQMTLAEKCRDMTAIQTPLGLLRMATIPQGATNSVAQFQRGVHSILKEQIKTKKGRPFLDDFGVHGPKTKYDNEMVMPGIRRYVLEHIQNLDNVLADVERSGGTIHGGKSQFCMDGVKLLGYLCDFNGRHPEESKVRKIVDWPAPNNTTEARAFLGICVYYRIWIEGFAIIVQPIYVLLRKNVAWHWEAEQQLAMDTLKFALINPPALLPLDYTEGAGIIFLGVDSSGTGWGANLGQFVNGKRHPSRYESGIWTDPEKLYDATKRECRGVLKTIKKFRSYLYGVRFNLETDANVLVSQLNMSGTDLPGALITRWLAWINLFDFNVVHVPGKKHTAADGLSRRAATKEDIEEAERCDLDSFIDVELNTVFVSPGTIEFEEPALPVLEDGFSDKSIEIATYLTTLARPLHLTTKEFLKFKKEAWRFKVEDRILFRRNNKNVPIRRVVDKKENQQEIMRALHDETGHKGREGTYRRVADRYWWNDMHKDVKRYVKSCPECQHRDPTRLEESLHPTWTNALFAKVAIDVVHMPHAFGYSHLVVGRDDLSGWAEGRALRGASSENVATFLWEEFICRHGCFGKLIVDGGPENKGIVETLTAKYGIDRIVTSAYHPQANGMIERGHRPIVDALAKMSKNDSDWPKNLAAVLWADRSTVKSTTGMTPYRMVVGQDPVLPIELKVPIWRILPWNKVQSTADLLAMRARQLERRDEDMDEAILHLERMRKRIRSMRLIDCGLKISMLAIKY